VVVATRPSDRAGANNRRVSVRAAILALGVGLVLAAAGCGASDRKSDAEAVAERFHTAISQEDGRAACAELSEETASRLEQQAEMPCEMGVLDLELRAGGTAAETSVYVTSATVSFAEGGTTFLDEGPDGWKVSAAGCTPTAPNLPYDCELEG
jgi:hypothetical protein